MKISDIRVYQVDLPLREGRYGWSVGKSVTVFGSTIVEIRTDNGLIGYGEACPLGPAYLPAYAAGVRAGVAELAPHLVGEDPRQTVRLNQTMDRWLKGHPYVKSAIDIACSDERRDCPSACCWVAVLARTWRCIGPFRSVPPTKWLRT